MGHTAIWRKESTLPPSWFGPDDNGAYAAVTCSWMPMKPHLEMVLSYVILWEVINKMMASDTNDLD